MLPKKGLTYSNIQAAVQPHSGMRFFKIAIYLFYIVPAIFISYLYLLSLRASLSFFTAIIEDPIITIMFVIAMVYPFCGALTGIAVNDLQNQKHIKLSRFILKMMAVSQLLIGNVFGSLALSLGLYKQWKEQRQQLQQYELQLKDKGARIRLFGNIAAFLLTVLCSILLIKIQLW
ncbi:MAG: hypothetical protein ACE3JP_13840 [Ectobacillus sp.]